MTGTKNQLENEVEGHLRRRVEKVGGICVKFLPDFARGFPDRIVLLPGGVLVWVETKRPQGGVLSPVQKVQHVLLRRLGQRVEVVWTKDQADDLIDSLVGTGTQGDADVRGDETAQGDARTQERGDTGARREARIRKRKGPLT